MANNNNNRNNRQNTATDQQPADKPAEDTVVKADGTDGTSSETTGDKSTADTPETSETPETPAPEAPVTGDAAVEEEPVVDAEPTDETVNEEPIDPSVASLNELLEQYVTANSTQGQKPEDFRDSALAAAQITRYVIRFPKSEVLDRLLEFFKEHKDDVTKDARFMMGSTTLNKPDEQKVGFINAMFSDLANNRKVRMESSRIVSVLGKPEFVTFYNRRLAAMG